MGKSDDEVDVIDFGKKKKKDKKEKKEGKDDKAAADEEVLVETAQEEGEEYTYEELLTRLHDIIEAKHAGMGVKEKFTMAPPQVTRASAKKTAWVKFADTCTTLHRSQEHLSAYVFAELGCDGTFAGEGSFISRGASTLETLRVCSESTSASTSCARCAGA